MVEFDFGNDLILLHRRIRWFALEPFVKRCMSNFAYTTLSCNWPSFLLFEDEIASQEVALAKKAVAFFKISRSI